jgi:carbamoyltransferase
MSNLIDERYCDDNTKDIANWFSKNGLSIPERRKKGEIFRPFDMHLATWIQHHIQISITQRITDIIKKYPSENICISGGVAMNSVLNSHLEKELNKNVFIPPSPGDAGISIGAASHYLYKKNGKIPNFGNSPYLGPIYTVEEIDGAVENLKCAVDINQELIIKKTNDPYKEAALALHKGHIIGWFQDGSEFGPRALGNRSILASPVNSWTKEILNNQIKLREWFRPYAPSVLEEESQRYFNNKTAIPYMMKIATIKDGAKQDIPACVHVDNTARVQTVSKSINYKYYRLIKEFFVLSGIPVVLNTSFNLAGMPIVETPQDAIYCFRSALGMSMLFLGNYMIIKQPTYRGNSVRG